MAGRRKRRRASAPARGVAPVVQGEGGYTEGMRLVPCSCDVVHAGWPIDPMRAADPRNRCLTCGGVLVVQ